MHVSPVCANPPAAPRWPGAARCASGPSPSQPNALLSTRLPGQSRGLPWQLRGRVPPRWTNYWSDRKPPTSFLLARPTLPEESPLLLLSMIVQGGLWVVGV